MPRQPRERIWCLRHKKHSAKMEREEEEVIWKVQSTGLWRALFAKPQSGNLYPKPTREKIWGFLIWEWGDKLYFINSRKPVNEYFCRSSGNISGNNQEAMARIPGRHDASVSWRAVAAKTDKGHIFKKHFWVIRDLSPSGCDDNEKEKWMSLFRLLSGRLGGRLNLLMIRF